MKTFDSLAEITEYVSGSACYVRYSSDIAADVRRGYSTNWATGQREAGLSVNNLRTDYRTVAEQLSEYQYIGATAYILTGALVGTGSDGEPLITDAEIIGNISSNALAEAITEVRGAMAAKIRRGAALYRDRLSRYGEAAYVRLISDFSGAWPEEVRNELGL